MSLWSKTFYLRMMALSVAFGMSHCAEPETAYRTIHLETNDGLTIQADVYEINEGAAPVILLFHQAGYSRGEYRTIAPRLNELGFTCIAIDQRSGDEINGVINATAKQAKKLKLPTEYVDAYPDLELLLAHASKAYPDQKILVWGSSYSASLAFILASYYPDDIAAVLAFSPGAYFEMNGKSIVEYAATIHCPVFMTCSRDEAPSRREIFDGINHARKTFFVPELAGYHGSKALWPEHDGNEEYWKAVTAFLKTI